jgi:rhodanese-related sulfurtransferase
MATVADPIDQIKERIDLIANTKAREEVDAGAKLIDVREPHEWDEAHLEGAVHVPQGELTERISEIAPDPSERLVLYCRTDNRSSRAADALRDLGYDNVSVMRGGIVDWQEAGLPVVAAQGLTPEQRMRYSRHTLLPEVGVEGQVKLLNSKVLLIGAGGLGAPSAF